jgi:hypothetical protein
VRRAGAPSGDANIGMHHAFLIGLNFLIMLETGLALCALVACLRPGAPNPVPEMRGYLIARVANTVAVQIFLSWPGQSFLLSDQTSISVTIYYFWYWGAAFFLFLLEIRVAAGAMAVFFRDLPGLRKLSQLASRWIAITGVILLIPLVLAIAMDFRGRSYLLLFRRWWYAFIIIEMTPVAFALAVGMARKVSWKNKTVGILIAFLFEPMVHLFGPWIWTNRTWVIDVANIANEAACCAAVALWIICYAVRGEDSSLTPPTPAMLHLNALAHGGLHQQAAVEHDQQKGAQPWPKYGRDV